MWHFRTWFSRHGGVGLTVGLVGLRGFSNLNDSMSFQHDRNAIKLSKGSVYLGEAIALTGQSNLWKFMAFLFILQVRGLPLAFQPFSQVPLAQALSRLTSMLTKVRMHSQISFSSCLSCK